MVLITKDEAFKLHDNYGVNFGENGISKTMSKRKKYYLCESRRNLECLRKVREHKDIR